MIITAPRAGGKEITFEDAMNEILGSSVSVEVNEAAIKEAISAKDYDRQIPIAQGIHAVNGLDGVVNYHFECSGMLKPNKNERDEMDYKDLGLVRNILAGTVIADITPQTNGEDGVDVRGNHHKAMPGKPPRFLVGKGTALNDDETAIVAAVDGNLHWQKDHFTVDEILVIAEDVGATTGNIDFIGDVQIRGNIFEGFTVSAKGNITINGTANNATVIAGGNVDIKIGCVNAVLNAKGNVKIGFCEGSTIECGGDLTSNSFVSCKIFCEGSAYAISGKGVVVGGEVTCLKGMTFNTVGSESYTKTRLYLGNGAILAEEKMNLEKEEAKITEQIGGLVQLIDGLNSIKKKKGSLPQEHEDRLASSIRMRFKLSNEVKHIKKKIAQIEERFLDNVNLHIEVRKSIWPGVTVRIGEMRKRIEDRYDRCRINLDNNGDIAVNGIQGPI
jgi:uncharacterized protein (DUF342 family)